MIEADVKNISHLRETTPHGNPMFPLMLYDISPDPSFEERIGCHWHEEIEFLVITKGKASVHLNGEIYPVKENSICLIPSNHLHFLTCEINQRLDFFAIVFHPDFLYSLHHDTIQKKYLKPFLSSKSSCRIIEPSHTWEQQLLQCLNAIREAFHAKKYAYELLIKIRLLEAFHLLAENTISEQSSAENTSDHRIILVKSIMEYLRKNYEKDMTLSELEKEFNLSKGHICRMFKSITHMTPFEYLNYYRINQSADLLEHSDDEISIIATKCGFNNISYYNRTFQKYMHMTPSGFRKNLEFL